MESTPEPSWHLSSSAPNEINSPSPPQPTSPHINPATEMPITPRRSPRRPRPVVYTASPARASHLPPTTSTPVPSPRVVATERRRRSRREPPMSAQGARRLLVAESQRLTQIEREKVEVMRLMLEEFREMKELLRHKLVLSYLYYV